MEQQAERPWLIGSSLRVGQTMELDFKVRETGFAHGPIRLEVGDSMCTDLHLSELTALGNFFLNVAALIRGEGH